MSAPEDHFKPEDMPHHLGTSVTQIGDTHFHVCERCGEIWCHTKTKVTPEERERLHRCPACTAGPYITGYSTRRDAQEVRRVVREASAAAITA